MSMGGFFLELRFAHFEVALRRVCLLELVDEEYCRNSRSRGVE